MLDRLAVESVLRGRVTLDHEVRILSPYSFEIRPSGLPLHEGGYQVVVDRSAFRLIAKVVPDWLAVGVRAAVVAGVRANPVRLELLAKEIREVDWLPRLDISEATFYLEAADQVLGAPVSERWESAVAVAGLLSEFVLDQLVWTRPVGEMRAAVSRELGEDGHARSEIWEVDPSERDKSTRQHRALENWLLATLQEDGLVPLDPAGEPYFDLAWRVPRRLFVCEVKSSSNSETKQLRLGLGQVLHYAKQLSLFEADEVRPVLLIEREPEDRLWRDLCRDLGVTLFWPSLWADVRNELTGRRQD